MALRNQPYLPLYVQDFLTDEKLMECSAAATGIYIRVMCILHKSETYGKLLLRQKDRQSEQQIKNFAAKLAKHLPYSLDVIECGLNELIDEGVLQIDANSLIQKRMVKDNNTSEKRSTAGKKGADKTNKKFAAAKHSANTEYEYESENEVEIVNKENGIVDENTFLDYCKQVLGEKYQAMEFSLKAKYEQWKENKWKDGYGKEIKNWKIKIKNTIPHLKGINGNGRSDSKKESRDNITDLARKVLSQPDNS